jgi:preprotein translocase subunit SecE
VARNRKRAKDRRARRPQNARVGAATRPDLNVPELDEAPDPIEHATPDVELAEAQLAVGRPDLADVEPLDDEPDAAEELEDEPTGDGGTALAPAATATVGEPRQRPGTRLVNFLQGCWRELQRVQWPDRRQTMQATGVVIGFVIVAGAFLGVADFLAGKIMNYVLTGHFK